ncbi:MAG TPA: CHRD domain-containing protein [Candidatus Krumholzibacteria bacterium]|nr:CHRD domain-containing protein [Candidatus Krumholzibacteria bacterium]
MNHGRVVIAFLIAVLAFAFTPAAHAELCFNAVIDGTQAGTGSAGIGSGRFVLNDAETMLTYKITFSGLGSAETAAHIHSDAEGGGVVKSLGTGFTKIGEWKSTDATPLTAARVTALKAGQLYVNIHSTGFPGGEIKGQILAAACEEQCFDATIDGSNTGSPGTGFGHLALNHSETELAFWIEFSGMTGVETAAHLHNNAEGGAAVYTLAAGSPKAGVWKWNDAQPLTGARVKDLKTGAFYVNIHSTTVPSGEISGDIVSGNCRQLCFEASLDGVQAGTNSLATGQGYFQLSHGRNRLTYNVTTSGVLNETAAHIHNDNEGGGVVRNIGVGASKTGQWDYDDATPLTLTRVQDLLAGALYVNVHTVAFAGGEIRGQMSPIVCGATAVGDTPKPATALAQNYPNPFNPSTTIAFTLATTGRVRLDVFDVNGAFVATLVDGELPAGDGGAVWNGRDAAGRPVASGVYFYRLAAGATVQTRKMVLLK